MAVACGGALAAGIAAPGWAHVEVSADNPQAGAGKVAVTFHGAAESSTAGIMSEQVVLPAGLKPADITLAKAPTGWTMTPTADGFTVAGPALAVGQDAELTVVVAQLPWDATELAFKTLETYSDGEVVRWIEIPAPGAPEPENPAPILRLRPAPSASPTPAPATATTPAAATATAALTTSAGPGAPAAAVNETDGGIFSPWLWLGLAVVAVGVVAVAIVLRRRTSSRVDG